MIKENLKTAISVTVAALLLSSCRTGGDATFAETDALHFPTGSIRHLAVHDGYAYVLNAWTRGDGVLVFDVRDPARMRFVNGFPGKGYLGAGDFSQNTLYVPATWFAVMVMDVSDPARADMDRNLFFNFPGGDAQSLAVDGDRLYLGGRGGGLRILDITEPNAPFIVAHEPRFGRLEQIAARRGRLALRPQRGAPLLAGVTEDRVTVHAELPSGGDLRFVGDQALYIGGRRRLDIYDVSDMTAPEKVKEIGGVSVIDKLADNRLLMRGPDGNLSVYDVSDPLAPRELSQITLPEDLSLGNAAVENGILFALDSGRFSLRSFDLSDDTAVPLDENPIKRTMGYLAMGHDARAFIAYAQGDNATALLSLPLEGRAVNDFEGYHTLETRGFSVHGVQRAAAVRRIGDYLLVGDGVVDISDPVRPRTVHDAERAAAQIAIRGNLAALAQGTRVTLMDLSALPERVVLSHYEPEDEDGAHFTGVTIADDILYVCNPAASRIEILDIADPAKPTRIGMCEVPAALTAAVYRDTLYVPARDEPLMTVVDVADPASPKVLESLDGLVDASSRSYYARVHQGRLYFTESMRGIKVADLSDPRAPVLLETLVGDTRYNAAYTDFEFIGDTIYGLRYSHLDRFVIEEHGHPME